LDGRELPQEGVRLALSGLALLDLLACGLPPGAKVVPALHQLLELAAVLRELARDGVHRLAQGGAEVAGALAELLDLRLVLLRSDGAALELLEGARGEGHRARDLARRRQLAFHFD